MAYGVLFLCTGNSARSILAEGILRDLGGDRFAAHSAGSHPKGAPHPVALDTLRAHGIDPSFARSKSWDAFAGDDAPRIDFIVTVCDNAAGEVCPIWPGKPVTAHWGLPDPADAPPETAPAVFEETYVALHARVSDLVGLGDETLRQMSADRLGAIHARG